MTQNFKNIVLHDRLNSRIGFQVENGELTQLAYHGSRPIEGYEGMRHRVKSFFWHMNEGRFCAGVQRMAEVTDLSTGAAALLVEQREREDPWLLNSSSLQLAHDGADLIAKLHAQGVAIPPVIENLRSLAYVHDVLRREGYVVNNAGECEKLDKITGEPLGTGIVLAERLRKSPLVRNNNLLSTVSNPVWHEIDGVLWDELAVGHRDSDYVSRGPYYRDNKLSFALATNCTYDDYPVLEGLLKHMSLNRIEMSCDRLASYRVEFRRAKKSFFSRKVILPPHYVTVARINPYYSHGIEYDLTQDEVSSYLEPLMRKAAKKEAHELSDEDRSDLVVLILALKVFDRLHQSKASKKAAANNKVIALPAPSRSAESVHSKPLSGGDTLNYG